MDNFGVRTYQSGKTRRRNANKKQQIERHRQLLVEERKLERNEITFPTDEKASNCDETQTVETLKDSKVTDSAMSDEQNDIALFPDLLCLEAVNDLEQRYGKKQS